MCCLCCYCYYYGSRYYFLDKILKDEYEYINIVNKNLHILSLVTFITGSLFLIFFIGSLAKQMDIFISLNDSLATIDIPIPAEQKNDIDVLTGENEQCISKINFR